MSEQRNEGYGIDHDLLIRVHERVTAIQQSMDGQSSKIATLQKEVEDIQNWRANLTGKLAIITTLGSLVGSVIFKVLVDFVMK